MSFTTYSGHENKVKVNIEKIVENRGMQDLIQCVVVPTEDVVEIKNGQRKVKDTEDVSRVCHRKNDRDE